MNTEKARARRAGRMAVGAAQRSKRSGWFDDETFEITADTSTSGKVRLPAVSEALGNGLSEMPSLHREVYLDNRAEGESKLEGSWRRAVLFWKTERWKKLLKG